MSKVKEYGSQHRLQVELLNEDRLIGCIRSIKTEWNNANIDFISPNKNDLNKELKDKTFWEIFPKYFKKNLNNFWVNRGPSWDLVAILNNSTLLLFEAKAHTGEMISYCSAKSEASEKIKTIFDEIKSDKELNINNANDWRKRYYQMANRIAHLERIRKEGIDAHLINIYFNNENHFTDSTKSNNDWAKHIAKQDAYLGIVDHPISKFIHKLFI